MDERLKRLIAKREAVSKEREQKLASRQAISDIAEGEAREDLLPEEDTEFRAITASVKELDGKIKDLDERITELADEEARSAGITEGAAAVRRAQAKVQSVNEGMTYTKGNGRSYLRDLVRSNPAFGLQGAAEASERLQRHATDISTSAEYRDISRTDGAGGYAVPPLWVMQGYVDLARAGRATANLVTNMDLPGGTDSINIPKMLTGTATDLQQADNSATGVGETDLTDGVVQANVKTIAGQQDLAIQLIDQSPINFDEVVFRDLVADYATKVDTQVISGSNALGQVKGIRNATGTNAITLTATTTVALYSAIADAVQRIHTTRFAAPTVIVMHPRRWAKLLSTLDTNNRPLVVPSGPGENQLASFSAVASQQVVGNMHGLPVVTDPNLPTNLGVGTNEDIILAMKADDLYLWESSIRSRVLPETLSGTLTVRLQVYGYLAFTAERYPQSVSIIGGVGLVAPTF